MLRSAAAAAGGAATNVAEAASTAARAGQATGNLIERERKRETGGAEPNRRSA
jgi:hypothetical protein